MNAKDIIKYLESKPGNIDLNVKEWLRNPANEPEVREILGQIWSDSNIGLKGIDPEFELLLKRVHYRFDKESNVEVKKTSKLQYFYRSFSKIAAVLVLPLLLVSVYLFHDQQSKVDIQNKISIREIHTKPGTRTNLELPDGTLVWLNDGTILRYPEKFGKNEREVYVDGEAYFEVKSNTKRPFIVNNPLMKTVVTGTRFNLNAYAVDQFFEATLLEGKINLESGDKKIELMPGQQIQYNKEKNSLIKEELNPNFSTAWIDGKLVIHNEKLEMAIRKLSRWYNVDVIIKDPSIANYELTCTLEDEKLSQCIDLIALALPIKLELKEEKKNKTIKQTLYLMAK